MLQSQPQRRKSDFHVIFVLCVLVSFDFGLHLFPHFQAHEVKVLSKVTSKCFVCCVHVLRIWFFKFQIQHLSASCPAIPRLIGTFEDSRRLFLVLPLCSGGDMYSWMAARAEGRNFSEGHASLIGEMAPTMWESTQ